METNSGESTQTADAPEVIAVDRDGSQTPTIKTISPYQIVLVRAIRAALNSLVGGGTITSGYAWISGYSTWDALKIAALGAVGAFISSALLNTSELLAKLDQTRPELRG